MYRIAFAQPLALTIVLITALIFMGCDDSVVDPDPDPDPDVTVSASFTVDPDNPRSGDEVTLDGSGSTVQEADELSFEWDLTTPDGSEAVIDNPNAEVTHFEADVGGIYDITLEVSAEDAVDTATEEVDVLEVEELSDEITEDRTLFSHVLYIVADEIEVDAHLTVEPGTRIQFERGASLEIQPDDGVLYANGEEGEEIVFTGTAEETGYWNGILILSEDPENVLDHTVIEYGGRVAMGAGIDEPASVLIGDSNTEAEASISNTTLRYSGGHGLKLAMHSITDTQRGRVDVFEENIITDNEEAPVRLTTEMIHMLDPGSTYAGNSDDYISVVGNDVEIADATWSNLDAPYRVSGETDLEGDTRITIEAGTELFFGPGAQFTIADDESGAVIEGEEGNEIVLTGTEEEPGHWNGIFITSDSPDNVIDHAVIEYAGRDALGAGDAEPANLTVGDANFVGSVMADNSVFQNSGGHGIYVSENGDINEDICDVNSFADNADGDCLVDD